MTRRRRDSVWKWCALGAALVAPALASAHETDQYTLPVGRHFADLGDYFSTDIYDKINAAVEDTNQRIHRSLRGGKPTAETRRLQSVDAVEAAVYARFPNPINHVERIELDLRSAPVKARYPGLLTAYMPWFWIYHHPMLVIDPTKLIRFGRCSMVMIDGVLCGNDKYVHFVHMGHIYYTTYRAQLARGKSPKEALDACIALGAGGNLFLSEGTLLGMFTTGVWSNADLASDYAGLRAFQNLTEEIKVRGVPRPPMLRRDGEYWRLADRVCPGSDFFTAFVTDHWNEALNPNTYQYGMDTWVKDAVKSRCADDLAWYVDEHGRRRSREEFLRITSDLSTWFGENYGYNGDPAKLVSIGTACFAEAEDDVDAPPVPGGNGEPSRAKAAGMSTEPPADAANPNARDALGRTELWWAARDGTAEQVDWLLGHGADPRTADADGCTPLHAAAMAGNDRAVEALLSRGADVLAKTKQGLTPLHLAVRAQHQATVGKLLDHRAGVDARDAFGCAPLHDAAARGDRAIAALLIQRGAPVNARDKTGTTPLHRAARAGNAGMVRLLLERGADATIENEFKTSPRDEARAGRHRDVMAALRGKGEEDANR